MIKSRLFSIALSVYVLSATGMAADATEPPYTSLEEARSRIEKHRKVDANVTVVNAAGSPVPGVELEIRQVRHEFLFGCNFFMFGKFGSESDEAAYRDQFAALFNFATLGFYWPSYERVEGEPNHEYAMRAAKWCRAHGIVPKGHPLAWNYDDPRWLPSDVDTVRRLQLARIADCVARFQNQIDIWDVVNEATHFERDEFRRRAPKLTRMWEETGRIRFVDQCFATARQAGPQATLLINDYRTDPQYARLLDQLAKQASNYPFDTIGIQSHMHRGTWSNQQLWEVCERFTRFGVPLHFTELTVLSGEEGWERQEAWPSTTEGEARQADEVSRIYTMLFSHPAVEAITWWDFADRGAWQQAPAGLLDRDLGPKPAYQALHQLIKRQWWTRHDATTDDQGKADFRGFKGEYQVRVVRPKADAVEVQLHLTDRGDNDFRIQLP